MKPMIMSGLFMDDTVQMPEQSHGQSNMDGDYNWCQYNLISQVKSMKSDYQGNFHYDYLVFME